MSKADREIGVVEGGGGQGSQLESSKDGEHLRVGASVRTVSGLTLVSRVFGLARDLTLARLLGDGVVASAFAGAFVVPNLFRRLFGEGALTAAFVPRYAQTLGEDREKADRYASAVTFAVVAITGVLTVIGVALALGFDLFLGGENAERRLSLRLMGVMLPFMPMVCASAVLAGIMQTRGVFGPAAAAPVLLNAVMIVAALVGAAVFGAGHSSAIAYLIAVGVLVAGVAQVVWGLWVLKRPGLGGGGGGGGGGERGVFRWSRGAGDSAGLLRETRVAFVPAAIALGTVQLNAFIDTAIAMWPIWIGPTVLGVAYPLDTSSNALLFYAQRLYQFPLGVFGIAVATVIFPLLSRHAGERGAFVGTLVRGIRLSLFIAMPATVGLILVAPDLTMALFGGSATKFSEEGVGRVSAILVAYSVGLCAYSLNHVLGRAFFAQRDTGTPMRVAASMVALNLALNLGLIWVVGERALAWSTAATAWLQAGVLAWLLRRKTNGGCDGRHLARGSGRGKGSGEHGWAAVGVQLVCCVVMGIAVWAGGLGVDVGWVAFGFEVGSWWSSVVRLGVMVGVGGASYLGCARLMGAAEVGWLLRR